MFDLIKKIFKSIDDYFNRYAPAQDAPQARQHRQRPPKAKTQWKPPAPDQTPAPAPQRPPASGMLELHIPKAVNFAACEFCILSYGGLEFHSRLKMAKGQAGKTTRIPGILTNFIVVDDDYAGADLYEDDGLALARATGLIQAGLDVKFVRESDLIKAHNDPGAPPSKVEIKIPTFLDHPDSIELAGASVVFSGKFPLGGKTAMQKQVREMGGKCATKTHTGCTHMVIGSEAKDGWKYGDFGVQIYEALTLKYLGHPIQIIREEDWLKASKK